MDNLNIIKIVDVKNEKFNEVFVGKILSEMPKMEMTHNARCVFYLVLKKLWYKIRTKLPNEDHEMFYEKDGTFKEINEVMEIIKDGNFDIKIELSKNELNNYFRKNTKFEDMIKHLKSIPKHASLKTHYDIDGNYSKIENDMEVPLFEKVFYLRERKVIQFLPSIYILPLIEGFRRFTKIDIEEMRKLNTYYTSRGYEYITHYNYLTDDGKPDSRINDNMRIMPIDEFKNFFLIPDIYTSYDIDRKVFKPIIKAINDKTKFNIVNIEKFRKDINNPKKITHYRINIEYKQSYLKSLKENKKETEKTVSNNEVEINF